MNASGILRRLLRAREWLLALVLAVLFIWFTCSARGGLTVHNLSNLLNWSRHWAVAGMLSVPMTLIIATGGIDLSVASLVALGGMVLGVLWGKVGWNIWWAAGGGMMVATFGGAVNGWLSGRGKLAPLVVTLATMAVYRGLAMGMTESKPITNIPASFYVVGQGHLWGAPLQLWLWGTVTVLGILVLHRTWIGDSLIALGENPRAARYAALPVDALIFWLYAANGLVAGLAAAVYVAQYTGANPNMEMGLELKVIACVVLGGTRITGGNASIVGTFLGVLIIGMLEYNLDLIEFPKKYQPVVMGGLVIVAAIMNETLARRDERSPIAVEGQPA